MSVNIDGVAFGESPGTRVMTGARAKFYINTIQIAYASNVSYTEEIQLEEVNVLDEIQVVEHAEVGYRVTMQCTTFRVLNKSVKSLGIMQQVDSILTQGVMTSYITDTTDPDGGNIIFLTGVKLESRQSSVDARGVMTETWNFKARKAADESEGTV